MQRLAYVLAATLVMPVVANATGAKTVESAVPTFEAARDAAPGTLLLKSGVFDPVFERLENKTFGKGKLSSTLGLVQFDADTVPRAELLEELGIEILDLIPHNAFMVRWDAQSAKIVNSLDGIRYSGPLDSNWKISPMLGRSAKRVGDVTLEIMTFPGVDLARLENLALKLSPDATIDSVHGNGGRSILHLTVSNTAVIATARSFSQLDLVYWVDQYQMPVNHNVDSVGPVQANGPSAGDPPTNTPIWDQGIIGSGQVVAVVDSGVDRNQQFFGTLDRGNGPLEAYTDAEEPQPPAIGSIFPDRKIYGYFVSPGASAYDDAEECGGGRGFYHGTHVAGSVAGDRGTPSSPTEPNYDEGDGMAPNAQILVQDIGNDESGCLSGITNFELYEQAVNAGAFISSNSFGSPVVNADGEVVPEAQVYATSDFTRDAVTHMFEDLLIVKSAGNDGDIGPGTISHAGYSKNVMTVGATMHGDDPTIVSFSSRGPTFDGRIKPDITAPGTSIRSAAGNDFDDVPPPAFAQDRLSTKSGTSMAAPTLSGTAALARQYFMDGFYPTGSRNVRDQYKPSGAMLKSVLLNGTALQAGGPDFDAGWGRVFLDNNLYFGGDSRDLRIWDLPNLSGLETGESHEYQVQVPAGQELRATLTWYDPPGSLFTSGPVLVNDLNLEVVGGGQTFRGNNFTGAQSTAGGSADNLNNVEQVLLSSPTADTYTIRVNGSAIPGNGTQNTNRQGYALAVSAGQCSTAVAASPELGVVAGDSDVTLDLGAAVGGANGYQVYRAQGSCSTPTSDFRFVGGSDTTVFADASTQGGYEYAYRVRGVDACGEGPVSSCQSVVSKSACTLLPTFDQQTVSVARVDGDTCGVDVSWGGGKSNCPTADVRYNVYRSENPFFTPSASNLVASGLDATSFSDSSVEPLTSYYYVVRAEDTSGDGQGPNRGNQTGGTTRFRVTTIGEENDPGVYIDDPDVFSVVSLEAPWAITAQDSSTGDLSYLNAPEAEFYPPNTCAAITSTTIELQSGAPVLSYDAKYSLEADWDGVVVEISTDGGANWQDLAPDSGYTGDFSETEIDGEPINRCGFPASRRAFNGEQDTFVSYSSDLSAFAGQTVQIRWVFSSDPGLEFEGFYLDNIEVTDSSTPAACMMDEGQPMLSDVSGPIFNVNQSGHGWLVEHLDGVAEDDPDRINAYWYVYSDGAPVWLIGGGDLVDGSADLDVFMTDGADFPPDFAAEDVNLIPWGNLRFDFEEDGSGLATWDSLIAEFGADSLSFVRLAPLADDPAACRSGSYFNADQSGHGYVVEVFEIDGALQVLVAWYVYQDGEQVWLLGQAPFDGTQASIPMGQFSGADFPPMFDPTQVVNVPWGTLGIAFTGPDSATITWDSEVDGFDDGSLDVSRLTQIKGRSCD